MRKPKVTFSRPPARTRLYFETAKILPALPLTLGQVLLSATKDTAPLSGEAAAPHDQWPFFFEVDKLSFDDALQILTAFVTTVRLHSDVHLKIGPYAIDETGWAHVVEALPRNSASSWGHYGNTLDGDTLEFAQQYASRLVPFSMPQSFNRVSNALRLYESALDLIPSDVALVVFMSVLEGLFSTATQELSYRLALSVSSFLASTAEEKLTLFKEVRDLYTARSKVVHGDRITANEEQAAILLAENYVPRTEEIARQAIRRLLEEGLEEFISTTKRLDEFYQLLVLGFTLDDSLIQVGGKRRPSHR